MSVNRYIRLTHDLLVVVPDALNSDEMLISIFPLNRITRFPLLLMGTVSVIPLLPDIKHQLSVRSTDKVEDLHSTKCTSLS